MQIDSGTTQEFWQGGEDAPRASVRRLTIERCRIALWWLMLVAVVAVAIMNLRFLWIDVPRIMHRAVDHLEHDRFKLFLHLSTAPFILVTGAVLFRRALRERWPRLHRWGGRIYLSAVLVTAPATFLMALRETEGPLTVLSFATLSILWFGTALLAWRAALRRDHNAHGRWMVRNYALTFTNVTFRAELHLLLLLGFPLPLVYEPVRILQIIPNLIVAELIIRSRFLTAAKWSSLRLGQRKEWSITRTNSGSGAGTTANRSGS